MEKAIADLEAELAAMGEHAPPELTERLATLKSRDEELRGRLTAVERKYALVKRHAERAVPAYQAMTVEMPKWRTTILLGLNSAAIVAAMGKSGLPSGVVKDAIWSFLVGAFCALASGSALDLVGQKGLEVADEIKAEDFNSPHLETALDRVLKAARKLFWARLLVSLLRYASLAFFAVGVLSIANAVR